MYKYKIIKNKLVHAGSLCSTTQEPTLFDYILHGSSQLENYSLIFLDIYQICQKNILY